MVSADQTIKKDLKHEESSRVSMAVWIGPILLRDRVKMGKGGNRRISVEAAGAAKPP